jgi:hypothetical protein
VRVADVPPVGTCAGGVIPCFFRHATSAVRVALEPPVEADAEVEVVLVLLDELLPQAASARLAVIAPSAGISRSARRRVLCGGLMWGPFVVVDQPPLAVELLLEPPPVVRVPESLTEVATSVPPEFLTPWMTTESPG